MQQLCVPPNSVAIAGRIAARNYDSANNVDGAGAKCLHFITFTLLKEISRIAIGGELR
jgi:hypothetical protein